MTDQEGQMKKKRNQKQPTWEKMKTNREKYEKQIPEWKKMKNKM